MKHYYENLTALPMSVNDEYPGIVYPADLYDALCHVWCEYTCTQRMRKDWSDDNRTLGQCSITSFLAQDIFGGEVYGIPLPEGGFHCFNRVKEGDFDLTSEQFGDQKLDYENCIRQERKEHFANTSKYERYVYLVQGLKDYLKKSEGI